MSLADPHPSNHSPVHVNCDLGEAYAFTTSYAAPPATVLTAVGSGPLHMFSVIMPFDLERGAADHAGQLVRSSRTPEGWENLLIQLGSKEFLCVESNQLYAYAETSERAKTIAEDFCGAYKNTANADVGSFYLLSKNRYDITSEEVTLTAEDTLNADRLEAMYPDGMLGFDRSFREALAGDRCGLSLFEGEPGTGKTTYLRHLAGAMRETHRFYYIPPAGLDMVVGADFIDFWTSERRRHAQRTFVAFLEDADAALMPRDSDNREVVGAILNLADGLLGNFLRLHILCTINCPSTTIDQALLRPGRLIAHHHFGRIPLEKAKKLAASKQLQLPERADFTLAEALHGQPETKNTTPPVGFANQLSH